jgi:tetratricopeptide (TPR) repeat protein
MIRKLCISIATVMFLAACSAGPRFSPAPRGFREEPLPPAPPLRLEEKLAEAEALYERGGFVHLRRAFAICRYLEAFAPGAGPPSGLYARTALLLAARAKEMGVRNDSYLAKARELIEDDVSLAFLKPAVGVVEVMPVATMGVWDDGPGQDPLQGSCAHLRLMGANLTTVLPTEPMGAYFRALLLEGYERVEEARDDLDEALKAFPGSRLLKFKRAALPPPDARLLEEIVEEEPEFYEAFLERGRLALGGGTLLSAEKGLLRAREGVPESPLIAILLAGVSFGIEEYDRSLVFYEETLGLAPEYKEALFGKAVCLASLGRAEEAAAMFEDLLARGPALRGECLYWLAACLNELGDNGRAAAEVERAKEALPVARVFTLAGKIAFEGGRPGAAEADLVTAVNMDSGETDAFFLLGKLYALRKDWPESALNFELAGHGYGFKEDQIREKIVQIEGSALPEDRKERLVGRKRFQLEKTRLTRATSCFNAAAGYHNAGAVEKALRWARDAAAHPYFEDLARDLIAVINSPSRRGPSSSAGR